MESSKIRQPAYAGQFYSAQADKLTKQITGLIDKSAKPIKTIACLLPHAGYMYSGEVAGKTISCVEIKKNIILLGPNHTGNGPNYSIMSQGAWQTPLGQVKINSSLAQRMVEESPNLEPDESAHVEEHSLEVELPLLQYFRQDFEIVPVAILATEFKLLQQTGVSIASAIAKAGCLDSTLIIASSDMTHYEPQAQANKKDNLAIEAMLELDEKKLMQNVIKLGITMCGYAPAVVMLAAAKTLGAKAAKLIKYETSGRVTGDTSSVVGYAGIIFF